MTQPWANCHPKAVGGKGTNGKLKFRIYCKGCNSYRFTSVVIENNIPRIKCGRCYKTATSFNEESA